MAVVQAVMKMGGANEEDAQVEMNVNKMRQSNSCIHHSGEEIVNLRAFNARRSDVSNVDASSVDNKTRESLKISNFSDYVDNSKERDDHMLNKQGFSPTSKGGKNSNDQIKKNIEKSLKNITKYK